MCILCQCWFVGFYHYCMAFNYSNWNYNLKFPQLFLVWDRTGKYKSLRIKAIVHYLEWDNNVLNYVISREEVNKKKCLTHCFAVCLILCFLDPDTVDTPSCNEYSSFPSHLRTGDKTVLNTLNGWTTWKDNTGRKDHHLPIHVCKTMYELYIIHQVTPWYAMK